MAQRYCHICFDLLCGAGNPTDPASATGHLSLLDFDHCVPHMKQADYSNKRAWFEQPQVALITLEKKSGCFCHRLCHWRGDNME